MIAISTETDVSQVSQSSLLITINDEFANKDSLEKNRLMQAWRACLEQAKPPWLLDIISSYETLFIEFDEEQSDHFSVVEWLKMQSLPNVQSIKGKVHTLPVCYQIDNQTCPNDIDKIAQYSKLSVEEIIERHKAITYRVYAVGFMPNFAYLGHVDNKLEMPRLSEPRQKVPAGSVAIADNQTAIYPVSSPGGWHIIGHCPIDLSQSSDYVFAVGDEVIFNAITLSEYEQQIGEQNTLNKAP